MRVDRKWTMRLLIAVAVAVIGIGAISELTDVAEAAFNVGNEGIIPTVYSTALLAFATILLTTIALRTRARDTADTRHWLGLAGMFALLAADEVAGFHSRLTDALGSATDAAGLFRYTRTTSYLLALLGLAALAAIYAGFLRRLPRRTQIGFLVAGGVVVFGALAMEPLLRLLVSWNGGVTGTVRGGLEGIEEVFEIVGTLIFVDALLAHLEAHAADS